MSLNQAAEERAYGPKEMNNIWSVEAQINLRFFLMNISFI